MNVLESGVNKGVVAQRRMLKRNDSKIIRIHIGEIYKDNPFLLNSYTNGRKDDLTEKSEKKSHVPLPVSPLKMEHEKIIDYDMQNYYVK